ncbi:MAG: FAD-binding oxidoreductase [Gammaproteobacteria bacterium]|uniref:FAD-binding oxidoreductase n=1 Tax=Rhodoferax sp. TaxID=50421 RepID=UPI001848BBD5|nr:FAD-binding oxidoreductase [Rhodoferax sp.]MBU3899601.1 FAD-binding oxidoreductase [Gammaproteobacteria bacterium]MBA3056599.1 FAD-binding oxidoreductase [Rhodoferax sp.]MBU3998932.1 FAD-binding oxidoreductase [Gammaproteobacteria bacterium]MBU4018077.1 FAD-binding oxidoreductase [Gammaproteobacteria bacterium]MBU4080232.1 FAD-binding oxidoreductase [Gammaproteobacteria bacterium]
MRRWNGWGDDATSMDLSEAARAMMNARLGPGLPGLDATREAMLAQVPASRLTGAHPSIQSDADTRFAMALGESFADWIRKRFGALPPVPDGVAFPESTEQVRELLDLANANDWVVIPFAGGTSVAGHLDCPISERPILSINLGRMNRLLHLDKPSQLASFEAGTPGPLVEAQLRAQGYTLGHFPQSFEYSTVGGWVVTRSSGQQSLRYGRIEQLFAGGRLEAPVGTLSIPTVPAASAGPDLRELVLGSEGRFGILTEATLRVSPLPEHESFHALFFPDWDTAEAGVRALVQRKLPLSLLRLSNGIETETNLTLAGHARLIGWLQRYLSWRGCSDGKCMLMLGVSADTRTARHALREARRLLAGHGAVYIGTAMGAKWAANRFKGPYLRNTLWELGYCADTIETAVDWPQVKPLMLAMEQSARDVFAAYGERVHAFTHLSHLYPQGSSIYSQFVWATAKGGFAPNFERWQKLKAAVAATIAAHGGTVSHQHGVGRDHAGHLIDEKGPLGMATLAQLCRHFDPNKIMNPGKLLQDGGPWAS